MTTAEFSNLAAPIVQTLKQRIIGWEYPPHHRFTEASLCAEFGVSRSPVREALRILATHGFVLKMANRGYAVRQVNPREVTELYELRLALELYVVEHLARQGTPDSALAQLRRSWEAVQQEPARQPEELARLDTRFHETLAELAGNETLVEHLRAINERLFVFRTIDFQKSDRAESTCHQHLAIIERIEAGDAAGARQAMRINVEEGRSIVHATIKDALARAYALA